MRRPEHALQAAVAHMLQVVLDPERTWWSSIDHGVGKLGKAEAGIRKKRGVKPGIPDIVILYKPPPRRVSPGRVAKNDIRVLGIELKSDSGRLSDTQVDVAAAWAALGGALVYSARSLEDVQSILTRCCIPMRRRMVFFPKQGSPYDGGVDERAQRSAPARHRRARRPRKSKNHLPLVLAHAAQKE